LRQGSRHPRSRAERSTAEIPVEARWRTADPHPWDQAIAQTNSYNDLRDAKTMIIMGGNPTEAHPISVQHILAGKEVNRANLIVIDPRFTRTAAHATEYVRVLPGTG
jgi:anaerobic selenocysteine-containing dehydrogenase